MVHNYSCKLYIQLQQFRKIEWALRNSHGRKKKKLKNLIGKILALVISIWLKQFPQYSENNLKKMKKKKVKQPK